VTQVEGDYASAFPAVSAAGDRAAIARGHTVEVYHLPGGRQLRTVAHKAPVNTVAFSNAGGDIVSGGVDGSLLVTRESGAVLSLPTAPAGIDAAGFLPDGRVVAADARQRLRVYDVHGAILAEVQLAARARTLRMSSDGRRLITIPAFTGKVAQPALWDLDRYRLVAELGEQGQAPTYAARFIAGGQIITACGDAAARLWDGATGKLRRTYRGGSRFLADVTLSADGDMLVGGGGDGVLRFWDSVSGRPLWVMPAHKSHLVGVRVEGDSIVTRGFSGDVARWTLPNAKRVIEACGRQALCAIVPK
jgi:WD40 repeat protein